MKIPEKVFPTHYTREATGCFILFVVFAGGLTFWNFFWGDYELTLLPSVKLIASTAGWPNKDLEPKEGYLVYSENCKIPEVDPWHPSIRTFIGRTAPLKCAERETLTTTEGNVLKLVPLVAQNKDVFNTTCCYKEIFRDREGFSDNTFGEGECKEFNDEVEITYEFIEVNCRSSNGTIFYKNFYSFIHRKAEVEKRCSKIPSDPNKYSILILGIDAVSRLNMHRQLNATAKFLLDELGAVEMYGFNKVGDNTFPNLVPLLLGYDERELGSVCWNSSNSPLDQCDFLWKQFSRQGYRTFYAEDTPHISSFNYGKKGFYHQPTDYYFRHFIKAYEDALGRNKPLNCYLCVGSISETEAVLQWLEKFMIEFRNDPYFAFAWINSLTHDFLNMGSSGDHLYESFFRRLHAEKGMENTVIVVMGDHGMRWGEIRKTYIGRLEERLPMLLIVLPPKFKSNHPEATAALKLNSHRLVTPFDLHATLKHLLNIKGQWKGFSSSTLPLKLMEDYNRRAISVFQDIPRNRSCDDAFIDEHWCTCKSSSLVDSKSPIVKRAANILVYSLNDVLKAQVNVCSILTVGSIVESRIWRYSFREDGENHSNASIYTVTVRTIPGDGVYEGTVKLFPESHAYEVLGTISRLNLYGNQSSCVQKANLKKYCYCTQQ